MSEEEKAEAQKRIAVIGNWHLAFVTAASLAVQGHDVVVVNQDASKPWTDRYPKLDVHEPGLDEAIQHSCRGRLTFVNMQAGASAQNLSGSSWSDALLQSLPLGIREPPILWLAMDTPLRDDGSPDVEPLLDATRAALRGPCRRCGRITVGIDCHQCDTVCVPRASLIVVSSQVTVGFCQKLEKEFDIPVAYVPENLQLGKAMYGFRNPDRLVIGATDETVRQRVVEILMYDEWDLPSSADRAAHESWKRQKRERILTCDLPTTEMIKHATNAFLATSISFANEMAKIGELFGADNQLVAKALKMDSRIGPKAYVRPGLGFSGGTLARDLRAIQMVARGGLRSLTDAVLMVNDSVLDYVAQTVVDFPAPHKFAVLMGYTYKADSDTLRCSPSLALALKMTARGLWHKYERSDPSDKIIYGYDPRMNEVPQETLSLEAGVQRHLDTWRSPHGANTYAVLVVITPLPEFKQLDWQKMGPAGTGLVFDLCDGVDKKAVLASGLSYKAIWQPIERGRE